MKGLQESCFICLALQGVDLDIIKTINMQFK